MTFAGYHPMGDAAPMGPPNQNTVDTSGQINNTDPGYEGGTNTGEADVINLPQPAQHTMVEGAAPLAYDRLELLDHIYAINAKIDRMLSRMSLADDESIKRRMRGPLKGTTTLDSNGNGTVQLGPVPPGEVWLVDRYIVFSDSGETLLCRVYDGAVGDPSSEIDFTQNGNEAVSDNTQPVLLFPQMYITFAWSGGDSNDNCWARVNYRSIEINESFANPDGDTNQ